MDISFNPVLPAPYLIGLGLAILFLTSWSVLQGSRGVWFRLCASSLVLIALFNPQVTSKDTRPLKDIAVILIDRSSSQSLKDRHKQTEEAVAYLKKETGLYQDLEIRTVIIEADGKEDKLGTRILPTLRQTISGIDPARYAGTVLISDGQIHDVANYETIPGPFHVLLTGQKNDFDRRIEIIDAPKYGLVGDPLKIRVRILDNGRTETKAPLDITLPDGSKKRRHEAKNGIYEITYTPEHAGASVLILETAILDNEISHSNNKIALSINGVRDRLRVLLVSGMPHQGQRTWRNILRSDPAVDLVHFTILRPSEKEDFTPLNELSLIAFPVRELFEEKLEDFDLIIFDRYYKHNVLNNAYFKNIAQYVKKGGALLVSAGPDFSGPRSLAKTPLNQVIPLKPTGNIQEETPFKLTRSTIGKRHPITTNLGMDEKEWGRWMRLIEAQDIQGKTILQNDADQPILVVNRVEKGRLAMLMSDHIWLWARGFDGGGPHSALVRNLVHWLMKEPDLEEEKLTLQHIQPNQLQVRRQSLDNTSPDVTLTRPDGQKETVQLSADKGGAYIGTTQATSPGIYSATDGKHNAIITLGSLNPKEFIDPRASKKPLEKMVQTLSGSMHWLNEGLPAIKRSSAKNNTGGKGWLGLNKNQAEAIIGIKKIALLPPWLIFIAALGLWITGWWRESR